MAYSTYHQSPLIEIRLRYAPLFNLDTMAELGEGEARTLSLPSETATIPAVGECTELASAGNKMLKISIVVNIITAVFLIKNHLLC